MKYATAQDYRKFYSSFAQGQCPEYAMNLNFVRPYTDSTSMRAFEFFMHSVQKKIPSPRSIRGMASVERTWKNSQFSGCLHMHCLLWGVDKSFREPEQYITDLVHQCVSRLRDSEGRRMASVRSYELTRAYAPEKATDYLTKELYKNDDRECNVILITKHGLEIKDKLFK